MGDTDRKRWPNFRRALLTDMAVYTTGPDTARNNNFGGGSTTFADKATLQKTDKSLTAIYSQWLAFQKAAEIRQGWR